MTTDFFSDFAVGTVDLDDSNEFFARRHSNHEILRPHTVPAVEAAQQLNKENNRNQLNYEESQPIRLNLHHKVVARNHVNSTAAVDLKNSNQVSAESKAIESEATNVKNQNVQNKPGTATQHSGTEFSKPLPTGKRATKQSKSSQNEAAKTKPPTTSDNVKPFRAYKYAEEYQKRQEYRMKKLEAEDKEKRKCIAKPMPNFEAIHSKADLRPPNIVAVVSPDTPQVLRRGLAMKEKLRQKTEEYERKLLERPPIVARSCDVLLAEPFKPKLDHQVTTVEPFHLNMNDRLAERKQWDELRERERGLRKEKEDKEKQEREENMRKLFRKQAEFKARPNPFK